MMAVVLLLLLLLSIVASARGCLCAAQPMAHRPALHRRSRADALPVTMGITL